MSVAGNPIKPLVEIRGLRKHYPLGARLWGKPPVVRAVEEISLEIAEGRNLGLVGESGCGKSTLGRAVLRLIEPTAGQILIDGTDVTALDRGALRAFRRRAQMIFQDPYSSLNPRMTVYQILREPLVIHGLAKTEPAQRDAAARLLEQVGLPADSLKRYPHEFSGGQRQRIGIARALAVRPRFIVADEPVSALDVSIQAQIINLLLDVQAREGLTYLFISHDLKVVEHMCQSVAVMYLGRLVEMASTQVLYAAPRHPYTQALLASVPDPPDADPDPAEEAAAEADAAEAERKERARVLLAGELPSPTSPPTGCAFHPRCARYDQKGRPAICEQEAPPLVQMVRIGQPGRAGGTHTAHRVACHFADG